MENLLVVALVIVSLLLAGVAVYAIIVLMKLRDVLTTVDSNLKEVATRTIPTLENLEVITKKIRVIVENFDEQIVMLKSSVETLKSVAENVAAFEQRVQDAIESPIMEVMNTLGGIIRGVVTFINRSFGGKSSRSEEE